MKYKAIPYFTETGIKKSKQHFWVRDEAYNLKGHCLDRDINYVAPKLNINRLY